MNVSDGTIKALYEIIGQCFQENRFMDRLVSVLGVEYAMNNTADLLHKHIAHLFPKISDEIGEKCLERYNITVEYASTNEGKQNYLSVEEMIELIQEHMINFQNMLIGVCKLSNENGDLQVYVDILDILEDFNGVVAQSILLSDKIKLYKGNLASYDAHIADRFWILE